MRRTHEKKPVPRTEGDERLYDEKVRVVRPGRLIAGFAMIGVAIIWLVLDNVFGTSAPRSQPTPTVTASPSMPSMAVAQTFPGGTANVVVQARLHQLNGRSAPVGSLFLVLAVQVVNRSSAPLRVAASDFTLRAGSRTIGFGVALVGHDAVFAPSGIPPKETSQGDLNFTVPNNPSSLVLEYLPRAHGALPLRWSIPSNGP